MKTLYAITILSVLLWAGTAFGQQGGYLDLTHGATLVTTEAGKPLNLGTSSTGVIQFLQGQTKLPAFSRSGVANSLTCSTADTADLESLCLSGGGVCGSSRGGSLYLYGNENSAGISILNGSSVILNGTSTSIGFKIAGTEQFNLQDGVIQPTTTSDVDLGDASHVFEDLYVERVIQTQTLWIPASVATAITASGWVVNTGTGAEATLATNLASKVLRVPVTGLMIGDTITAFKVVGQIESAGNAVTLDADMRMLTNAAADPSDASLGAITQVSKTADYALAESKTLAAPEVIATGEAPYINITATTATASNDIRLLGVEVVVTRG